MKSISQTKSDDKTLGRVLVVSLDPVEGDPRPTRLIEFLRSNGVAVDVVDATSLDRNLNTASGGKFLAQARRLIRWSLLLVQLLVLPVDNRFRIYCRLNKSGQLLKSAPHNVGLYSRVVVESFQVLPQIFHDYPNAKVIVDLREFYPAQQEHRLSFKLFHRAVIESLLRKYLPLCFSRWTISEPIANLYKETCGTDCKVIESRPWFRPRSQFVSASEKIRLVHHGVANRNRRIENLIDLVGLLGCRYELHLFLVGNPDYCAELKKRAGREGSSVVFHDPVKYESIVPTMSKFDIGLCFFEPSTRNIWFGLPNKFFEYIQAGVPVVVGPSPAMSSHVVDHKVGWVVPDFSLARVAEVIRMITPNELEDAKQNCLKASFSLSFDSQLAILRPEFDLESS